MDPYAIGDMRVTYHQGLQLYEVRDLRSDMDPKRFYIKGDALAYAIEHS